MIGPRPKEVLRPEALATAALGDDVRVLERGRGTLQPIVGNEYRLQQVATSDGETRILFSHVQLRTVMAGSKMTVRLPDDLKAQLDAHPEINWSEVARRSMREYLDRLELANALASRSDLADADAAELAEAIKGEIASHYEETGTDGMDRNDETPR